MYSYPKRLPKCELFLIFLPCNMRKVSIYVMHAPRSLSFACYRSARLFLLLPCHVECGSFRPFLLPATFLMAHTTNFIYYHFASFFFLVRSFLFLGFCFIHKHTWRIVVGVVIYTCCLFYTNLMQLYMHVGVCVCECGCLD